MSENGIATSGNPVRRGIGFAIRTALISQLEQRPQGLLPRLMTMKLHLKRGRSAILISAYATTMSNDDADKEDFYDHLSSVLRTVSFKDCLFLLGDFNAELDAMHKRGPGFLVSTRLETRTPTAVCCCKHAPSTN